MASDRSLGGKNLLLGTWVSEKDQEHRGQGGIPGSHRSFLLQAGLASAHLNPSRKTTCALPDVFLY